MIGSTKELKKEKQSGFISYDDIHSIFFNINNISENSTEERLSIFNNLEEGMEVTFEIAIDKKGNYAHNIRVI